MFGAGGGTSSYREVEDTEVVLLWGSNARETHPIWFHHLLKGIRNGTRLYVIDPRRTPSAQWGDVWMGLHVGSDIALSNTMAREIIHAGLHNREFIDRATAGFARAREADASTSFGIFSCSKATNEMNFLAQKFARQVMATNNIDSCNRT